MENKIKLSPFALRAIINLQHPNGTYKYYANALLRLSKLILDQSDEIGMSDRNAMASLRALHSLSEDLGFIAGRLPQSCPVEIEAEDDPQIIAERLNEMFSEYYDSETISSTKDSAEDVKE